MKTLAIALCRVSTKSQMDDGNLDPQIERVNKTAEYLETEIVRRWELAVSSRKGKNVKRKDLLEMRDFCRHNRRVKYLIVDEVDRFMRSINEYYWWKQEFKNLGVQLRHANRPEVDPDDDRSVFDELIDVYRAEQSNNERITKTPEKQMSKMRAGYYTFAPLPGYKTSATPSLHDIDPDRFYLLQQAFKSVADYSATPNEALKKMTKDGYTTINGKLMDMARFKQVMVKPYYAGIIQVADWGVATENGLHVQMITKSEHEALKLIISNKKKKFTVNKKNPEYPLNETICSDCEQDKNKEFKITGYRNHNGKIKEEDKRHYYHRYRCRGCDTYFTKEELHQQVTDRLTDIMLVDETNILIQELKNEWQSEVGTNTNKVTALNSRKSIIEEEQSKMALILATSDNEVVKKTMIQALEKKELEVLTTNKEIEDLSNIDEQLEAFIDYSIKYTEDLKTKYWALDWDRRKRCEQLLFPDGFYVTRQKKVYTPTISPIYRYKNKQKEPLKALVLVSGGSSGTRTHDTLLKRQVL